MTRSNLYRGFRYHREIIQHAVWLCHCFSLSLREVELLLATRDVVVSYESNREWGQRFGWMFANSLKRRLPRSSDKWFMDEVFVRIRAKCTTSGAQSIRTVMCSISRGRAGEMQRRLSDSSANF
jgi:putative transposase